jgi:hypothetical protein
MFGCIKRCQANIMSSDLIGGYLKLDLNQPIKWTDFRLDGLLADTMLSKLYTYNRALSLFDTMLNFVENLLENERDPRSGPMNDQDHSLSLSDPDRSLVLSFSNKFSTTFSIVSNKL